MLWWGWVPGWVTRSNFVWAIGGGGLDDLFIHNPGSAQQIKVKPVIYWRGLDEIHLQNTYEDSGCITNFKHDYMKKKQ